MRCASISSAARVAERVPWATCVPRLSIRARGVGVFQHRQQADAQVFFKPVARLGGAAFVPVAFGAAPVGQLGHRLPGVGQAVMGDGRDHQRLGGSLRDRRRACAAGGVLRHSRRRCAWRFLSAGHRPCSPKIRSAISMMPRLTPCSSSPPAGARRRRNRSDISATMVSDWPTPTVSDQHHVKACRFAKRDSFAGPARHAAHLRLRGRGAYEGVSSRGLSFPCGFCRQG